MQNPNILLINCDDLGYGDLGCHGSTRNRTPAIDRLAAEGLRLTDFYVASPICTPSRGALMTGCYPPRIGFGSFGTHWVLFPGHEFGIHENENTLPALLKTRGYRGKLVGKWHCGDQPGFLPTDRGFDEYFGLPYSNDMGRQVGRETSPPLPLMRDGEIIQEQPDQRGLTERYTEECVRFLRDNRDGPFFLCLAHMYVHVPLFVPPRFLNASQNGAYGGAVEHIDWTLAVLLDELDRLGIADNTLVVFTSDNGSRARDEGGSNAPCRGTKGTTWEGGQRVPCILRWPGRIPAGTVSSSVATAMDFLPTFCAFAGAQVPPAPRIDGRDLSARFLGAEPAPDPRGDGYTFFYYLCNNLEAVRRGPWKLHIAKSKEPFRALYNLVDDPGETTDLLDQHPDIAARLEAELDRARHDLGDVLTGVEGKGVRPKGQVPNPRPLTQYHENHPYMIAMYDLADSPVMAG